MWISLSRSGRFIKSGLASTIEPEPLAYPSFNAAIGHKYKEFVNVTERQQLSNKWPSGLETIPIFMYITKSIFSQFHLAITLKGEKKNMKIYWKMMSLTSWTKWRRQWWGKKARLTGRPDAAVSARNKYQIILKTRVNRKWWNLYHFCCLFFHILFTVCISFPFCLVFAHSKLKDLHNTMRR